MPRIRASSLLVSLAVTSICVFWLPKLCAETAATNSRPQGGVAGFFYDMGHRTAERSAIPKTDADWVSEYRIGALRGDAESQFNLGWMYLEGRGVRQSDNEAFVWFGHAAIPLPRTT
jgi:TPR repeat protein